CARTLWYYDYDFSGQDPQPLFYFDSW
nr:immunoglobulin heavy chain junction region [Macaca mulatta]